MRYGFGVILDFADKKTESVWRGELSRRLPAGIQDIARRKLRMFNNAQPLRACAFHPPTGWRR
jgi:toxin HigB-1